MGAKKSLWISEQRSDLIIKSSTTLMQIHIICKQLRGHPTQHYKQWHIVTTTQMALTYQGKTQLQHKIQAIKDRRQFQEASYATCQQLQYFLISIDPRDRARVSLPKSNTWALSAQKYYTGGMKDIRTQERDTGKEQQEERNKQKSIVKKHKKMYIKCYLRGRCNLHVHLKK